MNQLAVRETRNAARAIPLDRPGVLQRKCACGQHSDGGECSACAQKRKRIQRKSSAESNSEIVPPIVSDVLRSPGQPLGPSTRTFMESRFGQDLTQVRLRTASVPMRDGFGDSENAFEREADRVADSVTRITSRTSGPSQATPDFSGVQVHTGSQAAASARAINATAYTVGNHLVFDEGRFSPETQSGQWLLAHELSHVVQQQAAPLNSRTIQRQAGGAPPAADGGLTQEMLEQIARRLREAMAGLGTDEDAIFSAFSGRTQQQADAIARVYAQLFGRPLMDDLRDELCDADLLKLGMFSPGSVEGAGGTATEQAAGLADAVARQLHEAMKGLGTDEDSIFSALSGRTQAERDAIRQAYKRLTNRELEADLRDELSGSELIEALQLLNQGVLDLEDQIYLSITGLGTDEDRLFRALEIVSAGGRAMVTTIIDRYAAKGYGDMLADIRDDLSGSELQRALELLHGFTPTASCSTSARTEGLEAISGAVSLAQYAVSRLDQDLAANRLSSKVSKALTENFNPGGATAVINIALARQVRAVLSTTRMDLLTRSQVTCSTPVPMPCGTVDPCAPSGTCRTAEYVAAWTCRPAGSIVRLCAGFFECSDEKSLTMLHEFVHHNGITDKFYHHDANFSQLTPLGNRSANDSLDNADSYAYFAKSLG